MNKRKRLSKLVMDSYKLTKAEYEHLWGLEDDNHEKYDIKLIAKPEQSSVTVPRSFGDGF